jgi:hypothetical protein
MERGFNLDPWLRVREPTKRSVTTDRTVMPRSLAMLGFAILLGAGCGANPAKRSENARAPSSSAQPAVALVPNSSAPPIGANYLRGDEKPDPCAPPCTGECTEPITTAVMLPTPRVDPGGRCLETIASGQNSTKPILVERTNVYLGNWDSVARVSLRDGSTITVASDQKRPTDLAVDGTSVYWTNPSRAGSGSFKKTLPDFSASVVKAPLDGGLPTVLAVDQKVPWGIAVDSTNVYWTNLSLDDLSAGAVMKVPLAGGSPVALASRQRMPTGIAVHGNFVFWTADGKLKRLPVAGGTLVILSPPDEIVGGEIAVDATNVYCFASHPQSMTAGQQMRGESPDTRLLKVPLDGAPLTVLATALYGPHALTIDGSSVYWLDGAVMKVPANGGEVETIGGEEDVISDMAVDATSVYWASFGGTVKRLTPK